MTAHTDTTPAEHGGPRDGMGDVMDVAAKIREVFAAETPCPGGHRNDGGYGDYDDLWVDVMTEHDIPDEIETHNDLAVQNQQRYHELSKIVRDRWIVAGACPLTIPTHEEWDGDGEWVSFCYPVADGPCAETMQLNEDYDGEFWAAYSTQERLRKAVEEILCAATNRLPPLDADAGGPRETGEG